MLVERKDIRLISVPSVRIMDKIRKMGGIGMVMGLIKTRTTTTTRTTTPITITPKARLRMLKQGTILSIMVRITIEQLEETTIRILMEMELEATMDESML